MTPSPTPNPRPSDPLRFSAWVSVILLTSAVFIPFAVGTTLIVFLVGLGATDLPKTSQALEGRVSVILVIGGLHALFVIGAFGLRTLLNFLSTKKGSPFAWAFVAWALCSLSEVRVTAEFAEAMGARTGLVLWISTGFALFALWFALVLARALWAWSSQTADGARTVTAAAVVLVVVPGIGLEQLAANATNRPAPVLVSQQAPLPVDSEQPSPYDDCLASLNGPDCDFVWARAQTSFGGDAAQQAFIYVCIERQLKRPRLCGAFMAKARGLSIDAARYSRRFVDGNTLIAPACVLVPSPDEDPLFQAELDLVDNAKAQLPERDRRILDMKYQRDLIDSEIGLEIGLSKHTVRVLRRNAENELKRNLESCR